MSKSLHNAEYRKIIEKLRTARENTGLTQTEVAKKLRKPQSYISKIERGERRIDIVELSQVADLYGKKPEYFFKA